MSNKFKVLPFLVLFWQLIECQYITRNGNNYFHNPYKSGLNRYTPKPSHFDHKNGYNIYRNFNNDFKTNNNNEYENPVTLHDYYKHKPLNENWKIVVTEKPDKTEQFIVDYSEDEYNEPEDKNQDSINSYVDYDKKDQEHDSKDYKEAAGKKLAKLDKHSDSGHKEGEFAKVGGYHDKHLDAKSGAEHKNFKKDAEYSHDRGHGFIKAWSWDRKNIKGGVEGEVTKKHDEISTGNKGAFGAVAVKGTETHDNSGLTAIAGQADYGKTAHEQSNKRSDSPGKSDYDKEFPIFG